MPIAVPWTRHLPVLARDRCGLTLVEVIIAMLVLAISFSALLATFSMARKSTLFADQTMEMMHEVRQKIENKKEEMKQKVEKEKEERKEKLTQKRKEIIKNHFQRMLKRFEAVVSRLEKLIARIETRMNKIGYNDRADLNKAKESLASAKSKIEVLKSDFEKVLVSENLKESFKQVVQTAREIKKEFVEVHKLLVHIIGNLKGLRVGNEKE